MINNYVIMFWITKYEYKKYMNCETNKNNISPIVYSCKQLVYVNAHL
jgi:hypothetical protein